MNSPSPPPYGGANSRRARYSRSPVGGIPPSKRSKPSNSIDPYDHNEAYLRERSESYTSICVKRINPKISDMRVRELCEKKFSKYGSHSVKIYRRSNERVAFVNFTNADDARRARQAKSDLTWEGTQVFLDPVFYRKTVPASRPISPGSVHERFTSNQRSRHRSPQRPSSPLITSRSHSYRQSSSRRQRSISPPPTPPPPPPRSSRRHYSPYIPVPPDLNDYTSKKSSRQQQQQQRSSPSPARRHHNKQRSRSPNIRRIISAPAHRVNSDKDIVVQQEPSRILFIENLERNITESTLKQLFNRYGFIEELYIIKSSSTSKRVSAVIRFENMEMAYRARQAMDGHLIGETVSKIGYGKTGPTKHLWIGNIPKGIGRRDLEYLFSRYGQIEKFNYSAGRPTCNISFVDVEDAIKARTKLHGAIRLPNGQVVYNKSDLSVLPRDGFYIDYYDRLTLESRFNNRSRQNSSKSHSRQSSPESAVSDHAHSPSKDDNNDNTQPNEDDVNEDIKPEIHSRSPTPPVLNPIKERRSTDRSETSSLVDSSPLAGRTFHGALGSYLSPTDTANINNLNELMILCEQLNASATQSNTALSTVYPVQFILKSHAYDARMHFLAGSPTLTSLLLGQPGDLVAAKTELKITQRLRLEQNKLDDLEKQLRTNVTNALSINGNNSDVNTNSSRKQLIIANQTKFSILIATPKIHNLNKPPNPTKDQVKNEQTSPSRINENDEHIKIKEETTTDDNEEEVLLSRLISYLAEKEAAGVISIPFYPTYQNDYNHSTKQETAAVHIFPPCQFSKKILQIICPSINFSKDLRSTTTKINDEHLMVVIIHSE